MANDPKHFFAILMPWGRVGSNLVTAALVQSTDITMENEPTTRLRTEGHNAGLSRDQIAEEQLRHLEEFHARHRTTGGAAGLKLSHRSLVAPRPYAERLVSLGFRPVVMLRNNFLKCAVSQMRALARAQASQAQRQAWDSPWAVAKAEPKPGALPLDPAEAIRLARVFETSQAALLTLADAVFGGTEIRIEYRDLAADPEAVIRNLCAAIGIRAPEKIAIPHRKATSDTLSDDITNHAAFARDVRSAGLGHFLDDGA